MNATTKRLTHQIVVRVTDDLARALRADAAANGRTLAQSARFHLEVALGLRACS